MARITEIEDAIENLRYIQKTETPYGRLWNMCELAISALEKQLRLKELGFSDEVIENYKQFEDECITKGFTFNSLIEARDKQIPKKIAYQEYNYKDKIIRINGIDGVPYDLCPNCGSNLCTSGFLARKKMMYCEDCGQRLDWN